MITLLKQPVHCYMINDRIYMTEKMLIVMLSTNTETRERNLCLSKRKINKKKQLTFLNLTGFELATP